MNMRQQAARGVAWSAAGNWGYQVATLVVFAMLSRLLDPAAFGLVALAAVFTGLMKVVADQGMADALVQRADLDPVHMDTAFWVSLGMGAVLAVLLSSTAWLIADLVNEPGLGPVLSVMSLSLIFSGLGSVQRAILSREMRFASLTLRSLASVVAGGIVGVTAALGGLGVWSLVAQVLTFEIVGVVALWGASDWRPSRRFSKLHFRELFSFGANVMGFKLLRFFNRRADNLMIGAFLGATALGFYVIAYRLLSLIINITTSVIGSVAFPVFSRIQGSRERIQSAYYKTVGLISVMSFPVFMGLIVIAPEATRLVFGSQWNASVPVMRVLAIAGLLQSVLFINSTVIKSLGKPSWRVAIMGVTAALLVAGFAVAVQWGIVAVASALVVVTYVTAPAWLLATHRLISLNFLRYFREVGPPLLASGIMMAVLFALKPTIMALPLLWRTVILVASGAIIYGGLLWVTGRSLVLEAFALARLSVSRGGSKDPSSP